MEPIKEPSHIEPYLGSAGHQNARTLTQFIQHLLDTSSLISSPIPARKIQKGDRVSLIPERFPVEYEHIEKLINISDLNVVEKSFCLILINNYLTKRGLIKYQSSSRVSWDEQKGDIDLTRVYRFMSHIENEINSLKEAFEKVRNDTSQDVILGFKHYFLSLCDAVQIEIEKTPLLVTLDKKKILQSKHIAKLKSALDLKNKISEKLGKNEEGIRPDNETRFFEYEFVLKFMDILTLSKDGEEFRSKLDQLTLNKIFRPEFLKQLLALLKEHETTIRFLALTHKRFKEDYYAAIGNALFDSQAIQEAFADEPEPVFDPESKTIKVGYARFYFALAMFNKSYKWMLEYASCEEEKVLAAHILAILVCGADAPSSEDVIGRPCCFMIREFSDYVADIPLRSRSIVLNQGISFVQDFLENIGEKENELPDKERLMQKINIVIGNFVEDCLERGGFEIDVGEESFVCGFYEQSHLEKPFFLEDVILDYILFLGEDPNRVQEALKAPLYPVISQNRKAIIDSLLKWQGKNVVSDQMIRKIAKWFERIPNDYIKDLALLKFIEQCAVVNQTLPSNICRLIITDLYQALVVKDFQYFLAARTAEDFYFSFDPPQCDSFKCVGIFPIWIRKHQMNFFMDEVYSAELRYTYSVPSLEEVDHTKGKFCPTLTTSHLALSPFSTPSFVEFLGGQMSEEFINNQVLNRTPKGILKKYDILMERLKKFTAQLHEMDFVNTTVTFEYFFLHAFAIGKFLHLLQNQVEEKSDESKQAKKKTDQIDWKKKRQEVMKTLVEAINKLIDKYTAGKKEEEVTVALQEFLNKVRTWFPELDQAIRAKL